MSRIGPTQLRMQWRPWAWAMLMAAIISGCHSSEMPLAPVRGVVRSGAKPLSNVRVTAFPKTGPIASGLSDDQGRFTLRTGEFDGAIVNTHTIVLTPTPTPGATPMPGLGEKLRGPVLDTKAGLPNGVQLRSESPLTLTLSDDSARNIVIDVETLSVRDAD